MARITKPLTNTEVERAKPKDKDYSLMDGQGLFLRVNTILKIMYGWGHPLASVFSINFKNLTNPIQGNNNYV